MKAIVPTSAHVRTPVPNGARAQFAISQITQPWHIRRDLARASICGMLATLRSERPEEDYYGDPLPTMQIVGDLAILPIGGLLMMNVPQWAKELGLGITDVNDIEEEVERALNDANVRTIVPDYNSPGGWSVASGKLFDIMEHARQSKPVLSWVADGAQCCSAAYDGAAASSAIYTGKYATVGCIGSYQVVLDDTEFWKAMGITVEVFRSGELKGMGEDGYSDKQRAFLQETVDSFGARFRANVSRYRTGIKSEDMEGQWYLGRDAAVRRFTSGVAANLNDAVQSFNRFASR